MRTLLIAGVLWISILLSSACYSQDAPLGALPMQYNGSFAGEAGGPRINSNLELKTGGGFYGKGYGLYSSYDQFIPSIRSGIGITAGYSNSSAVYSGYYSSASNQLYDTEYYHATSQYISLALAPKFSISGRYTLSPSVNISYSPGRVSYDERWLGVKSVQSKDIQSRVGLLFNTRKFYVGYSVNLVDHYTVHGETDTTSFYHFKQTGGFASFLQLGYTFQRSAESSFSFTPQIAFYIGIIRTGNVFLYVPGNDPNAFRFLPRLAFNVTFRYKKFIWVVNDAGIHVGYQNERIKVMVSNSIGLDLEGHNSGYTGNLSFRYSPKKADK